MVASASRAPSGPHTVVGDLPNPGTTLFGTAIESILFIDFDGQIREANPAFCKILGVSKLDLLGKPFRQFVHPEDMDTTAAEFAKLQMGFPVMGFENRWRHKDGTWRWLSWKAEAKTEHKLIVAIVSDVTEQHEALGSGDVNETLSFLVSKIHAMDQRTRQFEGVLVQRASDTDQARVLAEADAAEAGIVTGYRVLKWAGGFIAAAGGVVLAIFAAGKTYQQEIGNNATKDDIAAHSVKELAPVKEAVEKNTSEITTVKGGVNTLVKRSDAEAKVRQAQRVVDKWQKDRDEQLQEWAAAKAARRTNRPKPEKRKELVDAELALEQAQTELLKVQ